MAVTSIYNLIFETYLKLSQELDDEWVMKFCPTHDVHLGFSFHWSMKAFIFASLTSLH